MRKLIPILLVAIGFTLFQSPAHAIEPRQAANVKKVIGAFKSDSVAAIARLVRYPLGRPYPLPPINGPKEFRARFRSVFSKTLIERIQRSNPSKDWVNMGWRGIMFDNGEVWLDADGRIIAVNSPNAEESKEIEDAIHAQKKHLNVSLRHFIRPILDWQTKEYRIRIDELASGKYRYAAWKRGQSTLESPSLVLSNGVLTYDGSGGNHFYTFENGNYRYVCYVIELGTADSPPGRLEVYEGNRLLMSQDVLKAR